MTAAERRRRVIVAGHRGVESTILASLTDPDADVRASALGALHRMSLLTLGQIRTAVTDPAPEVRRRSANLLGSSPTVDVDPELHTLMTDIDPTVVEVACWAAGERPMANITFDQLMIIATTHDDPLCRESAVAALGAIGDPRGVPAILVGCEDKPAVRRRAVLALAPFDGDDVEAALKHALNDRDWQVRQAAEDLL